MKQSKVSPKGQVTIPASMRKKLGITSEDKVVFEQEEGHLVLKPTKKKDLLDLKGSVESQKKKGPEEVRERTRKKVAKEVKEE